VFVICPRSELLEILRRIIEQATPEEKHNCERPYAGAGANSVADADSCSYSTPRDEDSIAQCLGSAKAAAVFVREPGDLSDEDQHFLAEFKVEWRD
jgi:hypothetical protein